MPTLRSKSSGRALGTISDADVATLRANLESDSVECTEFYLDGPTVDLLESAGASRGLVAQLRALLATEDPLEIELVDAAPYDGPEASDESEVDPLLEIPGYSIPPRPLTFDLAADDADEDTAGDAPAGPMTRRLTCLVCGNSEFDRRRVQLHGPVATFFNTEWLGKVADCRVCKSCGYMHWFVR